jgi:hypothetical protein
VIRVSEKSCNLMNYATLVNSTDKLGKSHLLLWLLWVTLPYIHSYTSGVLRDSITVHACCKLENVLERLLNKLISFHLSLPTALFTVTVSLMNLNKCLSMHQLQCLFSSQGLQMVWHILYFHIFSLHFLCSCYCCYTCH